MHAALFYCRKPVRRFLKAALLLTLILMSGCTGLSRSPGPPVPEPPENYVGSGGSKVKIGKWWTDFKSDELNRLVDSALQNNFSLQTAQARLEKAKASARKQQSRLFPSVDANADSSYQKNHSGTASVESESASAGLAASYEVDLWGKIYSEIEALSLSEKAARKDLEAAAVTVAAEITNTWIDLVAAKQRLALSLKIERQSKEQLEILKERFKNGIAKGSDVYEQLKSLQSIRSDMESLNSEIDTLKNQLVFLTGEKGPDSLRLTTTGLPDLPDPPDPGIPADLLEARPDVKAAGLRLAASHKDIETSRKDLLPKISISADLSFQSDDFSINWQDWLFNLAANLTAPVFRGGKLKQEVRRSEAARDEILYEYAGTVFEAVKEVRDALIKQKHQQKVTELYSKRLKASKAALFFAELEYRNGSADYVSYIERWIALKNLDLSLINNRSELFKYRVSLYRALGNSWAENFTADALSKGSNEQ